MWYYWSGLLFCSPSCPDHVLCCPILCLCLLSFLHTVFYVPLPFTSLQPYEPQLFKVCVQCLAAVAQALPPDHTDSTFVSDSEIKASVDMGGHFDPHPIDTSK